MHFECIRNVSGLFVNLKESGMCSNRGLLVHQTITPFCREIFTFPSVQYIFINRKSNAHLTEILWRVFFLCLSISLSSAFFHITFYIMSIVDPLLKKPLDLLFITFKYLIFL